MRRIAIIGGGPVGLYTAMRLSQQFNSKSTSVTLIEKRPEYTRDYILSITIPNFLKLNPDAGLWFKAGLCSNVQGNNPHINKIPFEYYMEKFFTEERLNDLKNKTIAVKIKDIEYHLLKRIECKIIRGSESFESLKSNYDIIIAADGANSTMRSDVMKSKLIHVTKPLYGLITTAKTSFSSIHRHTTDEEPQFRKRFFAVPDGTIYLASLINPLEYIYHKNAGTLDHFQSLTFGQTLFDMGINTNLSYSNESIFPVISSVSDRFCAISDDHPPIYLIGDALAVGNFFTGSGFNIGIDTADTLVDLLRFERIDEFTYVKSQMPHVRTLMNRAGRVTL